MFKYYQLCSKRGDIWGILAKTEYFYTMKRMILSISLTLLCVTAMSKTSSDNLMAGVTVAAPNPYNSITSIAEDGNGILWLGTNGDGLFRFDGANYIRYVPTEGESGSLLSAHVNSVFCDSKGRLWIGSQKGVNTYDETTRIFVSYPINEYNVYAWKIFEDSLGRIFVVTQEGLLQFVESSGVFKKILSFENKVIVDVFADSTGELIVVYRESIEKYDGSFNHVSDFKLPFAVRSAQYDGYNTLFVKTDGVLKAVDVRSFKPVDLPVQFNKMDISAVNGISVISHDTVIFITDSGHFCFNPLSERIISEEDADFPYNRPKSTDQIRIICKGNRVFWAATESSVTALVKSGSSQYDTMFRAFGSGVLSHIFYDGQNAFFISDNSEFVRYNVSTSSFTRQPISEILGDVSYEVRYSLFRDRLSGKMFIYGGNTIFELALNDDASVSCVRKYSLDQSSIITSVTVDRLNRIWASRSSDSNLYSASLISSEAEVAMEPFTISLNIPRLSITRIMTLKNGNVLAAFTDIGLAEIDASTKEISFIKLSDTYKNMYIQSLCEDRSGRIWVGTSDVGLFIYDPSSRTSTMPEQFEGKNISSVALSDNGSVLFSTQYTLYRYDEQYGLFKPVWVLPYFITDMHLRIYPTDGGVNLLYSGQRLFKYDQNNNISAPVNYDLVLSDDKSNVIDLFNFNDYSSNSYKIHLTKHQTNLQLLVGTPTFGGYSLQCRYRIGRMTDRWETKTGHLEIPMYNLSYGRHKIDIQLMNIEGSSYSGSGSLVLKIKRPWYISTFAMLVYFLLVACSLFTILKLFKDRQKKMIEAEMLRKEKEMQAKLNEDNIDFFANMSHEFRTPLTIISGAARSLEMEGGSAESQLRLKRIIQRNSSRMLKLVSQMLDFNKLEHDRLTLGVSKIDVNQSINDIVEQLSVGAREKHIIINCVGTETSLETWLDLDKFEKIMYNLLSNALKFTPVDGSITVKSEQVDSQTVASLFNVNKPFLSSGDYLLVKVADTGVGIPKESLEKIFERFGQAHPSQKNTGTGIGLYFAKMMVNLHHGFIKAESSDGAIFSFAVPMADSAYSEEEKSTRQDNTKTIDSSEYLSEYRAPEIQGKPSTDVRVLLIDDDIDIISFLKSILNPYYEVESCFDAMSGYKKIEEFNPDIIISDVMMVDMDGLQFCRMVRDNVEISHIPVILLTAKDTVSDQIAGMDSGADAYIVKPFDPGFLLANIRSILRNRDILRQVIGSSTKVEKKVETTISHRDKILLDKLYALLEESLTNPEMNILYFAEELGVSRTKLFYKVKALTGMTPSDFFTQYKLNRAVEYIKLDKYKIASIAEMCGFSSPSHFAALFKKQFGVLPSEYLNSL